MLCHCPAMRCRCSALQSYAAAASCPPTSSRGVALRCCCYPSPSFAAAPQCFAVAMPCLANKAVPQPRQSSPCSSIASLLHSAASPESALPLLVEALPSFAFASRAYATLSLLPAKLRRRSESPCSAKPSLRVPRLAVAAPSQAMRSMLLPCLVPRSHAVQHRCYALLPPMTLPLLSSSSHSKVPLPALRH